MTKKIFAFVVALLLIFCTSCVFAANNEVSASMNKAGNTVKNAAEGVRNVVGNVENGVENGASKIGNGVKDLGNTFTDGASRVTNDGVTTNRTTTNGYTATRTATGGTFMGMNGTTWTWFILAIAALVIVGLVWYYAMQNNEYNSHNNNN